MNAGWPIRVDVPAGLVPCASECRNCHEAIYREWSQSMHARRGWAYFQVDFAFDGSQQMPELPYPFENQQENLLGSGTGKSSTPSLSRTPDTTLFSGMRALPVPCATFVKAGSWVLTGQAGPRTPCWSTLR
jgi:hypothetical protein